MSKGRILVADDEKTLAVSLRNALGDAGFVVSTAADRETFLVQLGTFRPDVILLDIYLGAANGIQILKELRADGWTTPVIMITAHSDVTLAVQAMKEGAADFVVKPFDLNHLTVLIEKNIEFAHLESRVHLLQQELEAERSRSGIIGKSPALRRMLDVAEKLAHGETTTVLIEGESGTGKELVAKAVHENSQRRLMPFVVINCGGLPETLLESELFGYMKGSFTGAYLDKPGLFEVAHKGTIFLDEIGDLPPSLQVKFLRAVQEKTFRRIGGGEDIKVDVRIIAATNRNLADKVREGTFREDLYWRLNVIPIHLPPLRERKEDIPLLVKHFIQKYSREFGKDVTTISAYALELLMSYPFPGNIRELENIIERCVALETSSIILPENLVLVQNTATAKEPWYPEIPDGGIMLNEELERFERNIIEKALVKARGSKTKAAELLHVSPDSLRYRIDKLSIP